MDCRFDYCLLNGKLVFDEINGWLEASENPMFMAYRCSIGI
jgi:hypothetical protein